MLANGSHNIEAKGVRGKVWAYDLRAAGVYLEERAPKPRVPAAILPKWLKIRTQVVSGREPRVDRGPASFADVQM